MERKEGYCLMDTVLRLVLMTHLLARHEIGYVMDIYVRW